MEEGGGSERSKDCNDAWNVESRTTDCEGRELWGGDSVGHSSRSNGSINSYVLESAGQTCELRFFA